jgi:hypothetical protein
MADLPLILTRADLQKRVAEWPEGKEDTTWALCLGGAVVSAGEVAAIREAAKVCDRVAVARLTPDKVLPPTYMKVVKEAGADLLWTPTEVSGKVRVEVQGEGVDAPTATLLMQALVTVLPNLVVVERANLPLTRALRALQAGLGDLFTLRVV